MWMIGVLIVSFVATAVLGLLAKWVERKVTARVQWRVGPPWYQNFADIMKLLGKETVVPEGARRTGFLLWPVVGLSGAALAAAVLWMVNWNPEKSFVADMIGVIYVLVLPSLAMIMGGSASGNPQSGLGASREMKLLFGYELPFILALVTVVISVGTFNLGEIIKFQGEHGSMLLRPSALIGFLIGIICIQAKLGLVPFDIAEAETEIMSGPFVEYSGPPLALFLLSKAMLLIVLPMFLITVFWGGFVLHGVGVLFSIIKYVVILVVLVLIRNTNPRLRIDQAVRFFWFLLLPIALIAVMLALNGY